MNPNGPESRGGIPALLRTIGVAAVAVVALIGVLAVLEIIPAEAIKEWVTKAALVVVIFVAAAVAVVVLIRGNKS